MSVLAVMWLCRYLQLCSYVSTCSYVAMSVLAALIFSTTENLCIYVWDQMARELKDNRKLLYEVCIHETKNNTFYYRGE